jgi:hypothetical protein
MDFDEAPAESVQGWKGHTACWSTTRSRRSAVGELTRLGYNYNWQNYSATGPAVELLQAEQRPQDQHAGVQGRLRACRWLGGIELRPSTSWSTTRTRARSATPPTTATPRTPATPSAPATSSSATCTAASPGGKYKRDITKSVPPRSRTTRHPSLRLSYNLAGFETGLLSQWVKRRRRSRRDRHHARHQAVPHEGLRQGDLLTVAGRCNQRPCAECPSPCGATLCFCSDHLRRTLALSQSSRVHR